MPYRQVRGFDLQFHAVDPATGDALCGLPGRKLGVNVGGFFRGRHAKSCAACTAGAEARPDPRRRSRPGPRPAG